MTTCARWMTLALLTVIPLRIEAQNWYGGFTPYSVFLAAPADAGVLIFATNLSAHTTSDTLITLNLEGSPGITSDPSEFQIERGISANALVRISVNLKDWVQYPCGGMPNGLWVHPSDFGPGTWVMIYGYVYDPKTEGRAHVDTTTLNFGRVIIDTFVSQDLSQHVFIDSLGSRYRYLRLLDVRAPFFADDSIQPMFAGTGIGMSPYCLMDFDHRGFIRFQPTQPGHYIDTAFLFDPLQGDSTMLILEGDGVNPPLKDVDFAPSQVSSVSIYPNPCSDVATVALHGMWFDQITILSILGTRVKEFRNVNSDLVLDASVVPDGFYVIEAQSRNKVMTKCFLVMH